MPTKNEVPVTQFLAEEVYLPGYMSLREQDYGGREALFEFNIQEPPVARGSIIHYATPRGYHIAISQGGYALTEHLLNEGDLEVEGVDIERLRKILLTGRVKIGRLDEHFRREVQLGKPTHARFELRRIRKLFGETYLEFGFDFANRSMWGMFLSSIKPSSTVQLNAEVIRIQNAN